MAPVNIMKNRIRVFLVIFLVVVAVALAVYLLCYPALRDLPQIKESGRLVMLTRNNTTTFFIYRGFRYGFEYELLKHFADENKLKLKVKIINAWDQMIPALRDKTGDIIASNFTITPQRARRVSFTEPYLVTREVVVASDKVTDVASPEDLDGKTVHVRRSSSYYQTLKHLEKSLGIRINVKFVDEDVETEEILYMVSKGKFTLTVADSYIAELQKTFYPNLKILFPVSHDRKIAWAVRKSSPELLKALNSYIKKIKKDGYLNIIRNKYFRRKKWFARIASHPGFTLKSGRISEFDELIKRAAAEVALDWRFIAAVISVESGFSPSRKSWAGAVGLMQLVPRTAEKYVRGDVSLPENNILAGSRYLKELYKIFAEVPDKDTRLKFVLAAYNAGMGHVWDAMTLAEELGLDKHSWEGLKKALELLSKKQYHSRAKYGYVRGWETVNYVEKVWEKYQLFRTLVSE